VEPELGRVETEMPPGDDGLAVANEKEWVEYSEMDCK
jgi:hypothetical protein